MTAGVTYVTEDGTEVTECVTGMTVDVTGVAEDVTVVTVGFLENDPDFLLIRAGRRSVMLERSNIPVYTSDTSSNPIAMAVDIIGNHLLQKQDLSPEIRFTRYIYRSAKKERNNKLKQVNGRCISCNANCNNHQFISKISRSMLQHSKKPNNGKRSV